MSDLGSLGSSPQQPYCKKWFYVSKNKKKPFDLPWIVCLQIISCLYRNSCQWDPLITKKLQFRSKSNASFFLYQLIYWFFSLLQISCLSKNEKDKNRWIIITNTSYMLNVLLLLTEGNPEFVDYCSWWVNWARYFTIAHYF